MMVPILGDHQHGEEAKSKIERKKRPIITKLKILLKHYKVIIKIKKIIQLKITRA